MKTTTALLIVLAASVTGCGWIPGEGFTNDPNDEGATADDLPEASAFSCGDLDTEPLSCVDFNDGNTPGFRWEGGEWSVVDGRLLGYGPDAPAGTCTGSLMTHAVLTTASAQDVHVTLEMASVERVDKVLLLRSVDDANRLQLNFRALSRSGNYGDLMVQETRDCVFSVLTQEGEIPIGHEIGEKIKVDVRLMGAHLRVKINEQQVLDRDFPIAVTTGSVGLGVIDHATTMFDDLVIEQL